MDTEFIEFLAKNQAIRFGDFTLKSGRQSPYFISTGVLANGKTSYELGKFYAKKINEVFGEVDAIYGPAYKGIPLAVSASIAMYKEFGKETGWIFDRKEKKVHGDKGGFVGSELDIGAKLVLVDDVMTTGETKIDAIKRIEESLDAKVLGIVIAVDREELGIRKNATEELSEKIGIPIHSITKISEVFEHLRKNDVEGRRYVEKDSYDAFLEYRKKYGVK
ncbi:MAG: orotate phosphoribosyltransferase [Candidatus ainarchaeum sp.]|nr:orotate phosphoribosyltransferase [Candidatus ainarchaeum sp.]